ncbi:MAG TPA: FmdB family zinc ribbon protein [Steroidobacteraceae bacterium]|nr:FmdB family zinc ribbon protein [Steroidobacteraceae bacterium]
MPFYEYQCKSCGHTLEAMQKVNDSPLKKCPDCGKSQLVRLMSAPVFRLKGGGWYETDFKGDQDNKKNLADRPEAEAAKDDKKPAADAKDAGGKEVGKDAAGKDAGGKDAAKPAEKAADKPAEKAAPTESAKKPAGGGMSRRGTPARPSSKKAVKKPAKKPATKARRRG